MQAIHFHGVLLTVSGGDTIAIYHCSIKIVSRGKGKSAVAAAAYRAGEKLTNEWDGLTHDYTRKGGVVHSEIMLPPHAPPSFSDRSILWNSVEQIEKSNNSQLAREIEIALPVELSREEQTRLVREYCSSQFVSKGMCADFNIHDTGNGNPHAHILLTMRPLDEKGTWAAKSKKEYVLDENGERVKLPSGRYKTRKVDLMDWNRQENADLWRKAWADLANDYLERSGSAERIDHRSHAERGIEELPTVHMGVAASQMEKKGIATDKGEINRMIQKTNRLMREIRGYIDSLKEWLAEVFAAKKQLQAAPHSPDIATLLTRYLSIEREKSRKYSQGWQQQHTAGELQKISKAIVYLQSKGIATLEDLDAALSSVDEEAKRLNTSVVAKQKRMRTLEKFIEHGSNYNRLKPIHDELKTLKNGWGKKREKFEQAHESDLIIWNAANRFLHANLPEGTKSFKVSEWQKEFDELKAQSTGEYEELKTKRSEVKELQQIRKCIDIVEQAEQKRMRTLEKFIEHGSNYNRLKPIHDELKTLKNGWGKKREKFEQAHESDLIIWNAANRFLHANLPEGTKSFKVSEWQKEFDELKAQSTGEYEELKTKRSEVKELQQIRKCIDIVEQAEQRTQEQTHQTPRRKKEDISL